MSSLSLSLLNLLGVAHAHASSAPEAAEKDGFKALLDLGASENGAELDRRQPKPRKENFAAPVEEQASQARAAEVQQKANPVIAVPQRKEVNEAPAEEKAVKPEDAAEYTKKEAAAPAKESPSSDKPREIAETKETETVVAATDAEQVVIVSEVDAPDTRETLVAELRGHIAFLSELLRFLQSLGGRVGAVQYGNVTVQVSGVQLTSLIKTEGVAAVGAKGILSSDAELNALLTKIESLPGFADAKPLPGNTPESLVNNIEGLLSKLQSVLSDNGAQGAIAGSPQPLSPKQLIAELPSILGALAKSIRSLAAMLKENPEAQVKFSDRLDKIIAQVKDIRETLGDIVQKLQGGPKLVQPEPANPDVVADKSAPIATKEMATAKSQAAAVAASPVAVENAADKPAAPQAPTQQVAQQAAAAALQTGSQSGTSSNGQQQNNQAPLPNIAAVRGDAPASQAQNAAAPDFAKLVAQAKTPVLDQVAFQIKSQANGISKINIQLQPEALGKVEIKLSVDAQGKTQVQVTAENRQTLDLLQRDARGLERALSDAGLKADSGSLSFNLKGGQQEQHHASSHSSHAYVKPMHDDTDESAGVITRSYVMEVAEGLDIRI